MKDSFNVHHQIANCIMLMDLTEPDTIVVQPGKPIHCGDHILIRIILSRWPDSSTLFLQFEILWKYMLMANDK